MYFEVKTNSWFPFAFVLGFFHLVKGKTLFLLSRTRFFVRKGTKVSICVLVYFDIVGGVVYFCFPLTVLSIY